MVGLEAEALDRRPHAVAGGRADVPRADIAREAVARDTPAAAADIGQRRASLCVRHLGHGGFLALLDKRFHGSLGYRRPGIDLR